MRQVGSFAAVGVVGYLVDTAVLLAVASVAGPYAGRLISFLVAVLTTWLLNRSLTFRHHPSGRRRGAEFALYLVSMLGGGATNLTVYGALVHWLDPAVILLPILVAIGSLAGMMVNLTLARRVVFSSARKEPLLPPLPARSVWVPPLLVLQVWLGLLLAVALVMPASITVEVTAQTEQAGDLELFTAAPAQPFSPKRRTAVTFEPSQTPQTFTLEQQTWLPISRVRLDLGQSPGQLRLSEVVITQRWSQATFKGQALKDAVRDSHDLATPMRDNGDVIFSSTGSDPHFSFNTDLTAGGMPWQPWAIAMVVAGIALTLLWMVVVAIATSLASRKTVVDVVTDVRRFMALGLVVLAMAFMLGQRISDATITGDGRQNLWVAMNLIEHSSFAHQLGNPPTPSNLREPLPPLMAGVWIGGLQAVGLIDSIADIDTPAGGRMLKWSNIAWVFVGLLSTYLLTQTLTNSRIAATAALVGAAMVFYGDPARIDTLYTELHGAALLSVFLLLLVHAWRQASLLLAVLAGIFLGLLVLTKVTFFYLALILAVIFPIWLLWVDRAQFAQAWRGAIVVTLTALLFISPWAIRNYMQFDRLELTSVRDSHVFLTRALMNGMTLEEQKGALYIGGPTLYRQWVEGTTFDMQPGDIQRDGRWQRLNPGPSDFLTSDWQARQQGKPEQVISFHHKAAATIIDERQRLSEAGIPFANMVAGDVVSKKALQQFAAAPVKHLQTSAIVLWQGFWSFPSYLSPWVRDGLNLLAGLALISLAIGSFLLRKPTVFLVVALPFGMLAGFALFSHGLSRYMTLLHPMMMVALVVLVHQQVTRHD